MSEENETTDQAEQNRIQQMREWAAAHPKRTMLAGGAFALLSMGTVAAWIALSAATAPAAPVTIDDALQALDKRELEYAEDLVLELQNNGTLEQSEIGGPLFVLGAVKILRAEQEFSPELRRQGYLIASGYLSKANEAGFPANRTHQGLYLLGKSLIKSYQLSSGVQVLEEALKVDPQHVEDIHRLIAEAYFYSETPIYPAVLHHLNQALATSELQEPQRSEAQLLKAQTLAMMDRFDQAHQALQQASPAEGEALKSAVETQLHIAQLMATPPGDSNPEFAAIIQQATQALNQTRQADRLATQIGVIDYLEAQLLKLRGNTQAAIDLFETVYKRHGQEPEGIAAAVGAGQIYQQQGELDQAIHSYRLALESVDDPINYRSSLLPLSRLRSQILGAYSSFIAQNQYHAAAEIVDRLYPVFSRNQQLEMRASTLASWGRKLLHDADTQVLHRDTLRSEGRKRLREAGLNYELLADARFADARYPTHLWQAAEAYFEGQSYSSALRSVREYLKHEPQERNALALLRLGQSRMAMGKPHAAIEAFQECIEFHPEDAATYSARLECAKAYRDIDNPEQAEQLLLYNLHGSSLSPQSPEWRDSKFEVGRLLYDHHRYDEAIVQLEEAILRYPNDHQTRLAKYLVAEAYRHAADQPLELYEEARTVNERERSRDLAIGYLGEAIVNYEKVRREIAMQPEWSEMDRATIRNCYMFKGAALFQLGLLAQEEAERLLAAGRDKDEETAEKLTQEASQHLAAAVQAYSDLSAQFQDEPIILEVLVQIAECWRRLEDKPKARGQIERALGLLEQLPRDTDFSTTTSLTRNEWQNMLNEMRRW